jgi:o-succinylbenzoate synthase
MVQLETGKAQSESVGLLVQRIALHRVRVPLCEPFRISNGVVAEKDAILVEVETDNGVIGWGEASPMSGAFYSDDTPEGAWAALNEKLIPLALDEKVIDAPRFFERLREVPGEAFAKAGLEGALWDAHALALKMPLHKLFGADVRPVPSGVAIGIYDTVDELLGRVERYVGEGYRRVKIKIQPGWDVEPIRAVRARFPDVPLMVDANAAYTLDDLPMFRELDADGLMMIEQPLKRDQYDAAAELQRELRTPLCADESAESLDALELLIRKQAARIINIKVQRVGGLSEAYLMLKRAREAGLACWVGTMPELGIASAQGLHLAMLDGFSFPTDIEASARWYVDDVIDPSIEIDKNGYIHVPADAGSGFRINRAKVERYAIAHAEFGN